MSERISEHMMQPAEQVQNYWLVTAPAGTERSAPLDAAFWVHVSRKLRPLARVNVVTEDGAWYQELLCTVADGRDIRMHEMSFHALDDSSDLNEKIITSDMSVSWGGPTHLWRVVRVSDGVILAKNMQTRADANHWVAINSRRVA